MALETSVAQAIPSAEVVGNAFVEQYYHILHNSPESVYRFYQDISVVTRPEPNGVMSSVSTLQGINEKILSLQYKDYKVEIRTADAQKSYKDGVTVLVTGCLTSKDHTRRKFAQSFFLAPQDNGYFVLNDVFRHVEDDESVENHPSNGNNDALLEPVTKTKEPVPTDAPEPLEPEATSLEEGDLVVENLYDPSISESQLVHEKDTNVQPQSYSTRNDASVVVEASYLSQEDAPKKSYASIVKVPKGNSGQVKVYVPTNTVKVAPKKTENQPVGSEEPISAAKASAPVSAGTPESSKANEKVEGYSIYVSNLPLNVTAAQLEVEFKRFGSIKQGGIQVRNHRGGYCYGFVEFISPHSMNSAIQASPITIGGQQAIVEIKKTTTQVGDGREGRNRFYSGRGGFRNDIFRGRGGYGGGRGFVRYEYGVRGEFSGRGRGPAGRGVEGYQQGRSRGRGNRLS